jgi:alanine racemase
MKLGAGLNSWIEISEERLAANYRALGRAVGPETQILAVVKANAYGHGAAVCAPILVRAGAKWLGVTSVREGAVVRAALGDAEAEILVMCGMLPEDAAPLAEHRMTPVVWTAEQVGWLSGHRLNVHVEVDTGMSRQGVRPGQPLGALLDLLAAHTEICIDGIFTHYASSEVAGSQLTRDQQRLFEVSIAQIAERELRPTWVHAGNTSSVDNPNDPSWLQSLASIVGAKPMVRSGLGLYGHCLPIEPAGTPRVAAELQQVMTWKSRVLSVCELAPGDTVGYNATFTAEAPMRVALMPVGYADGLRRELSSTNQRPGGWVMIGGGRAPILGRISMNLTTLDVTGIAEVQPGDEVIVLGEGVSAEDHARLAGTIAYEILCGIHPCG